MKGKMIEKKIYILRTLMIIICINVQQYQTWHANDPICDSEGACFKIMDRSYSWDEAVQECEKADMTLASVVSLEESNFVAGLLGALTRAWIGLKGTSLTWTNGGSVIWSNWDPNGQHPEESQCVTYTEHGTWGVADCSVEMEGICKSGGKKCNHEGICFKFVAEEKTWQQSLDHCNSLGMTLATFSSETEWNFASGITNNSPYWIGLTGTYKVWVDGTAVIWTKFHVGENLVKYECIYNSEIEWFRRSCEVLYFFLCKSVPLVLYSSSLLISPTTTIDQVSSTTDIVRLVSSSSSLLIPPITTIDQVSSTTDTVVMSASLSSGSSAISLVQESTATITTQPQLSQSPALTLQPTNQPALSTETPQPTQQHPLSTDLPSLTAAHVASLSSSITPSSSTVFKSSVKMPVKRERSTRAKLNGRLYFSSEEHVNKRLSASIIRTEWRAIDHVICMHMYCDKEDECESLNFNPESKECELLSAKYTGGNYNLEQAPGWKYYERMK